MAEIKQNLPFRPLEVRGHGIWDPERKTFYPFKTSNLTVPAKSNIRYFIYKVCGSLGRVGVQANGTFSIFTAKLDGNTVYIGYYTLSEMTQTTDHQQETSQQDVFLLVDPGTPLIKVSATAWIVYAEIPDDISGQ